MGYLTLTKNWRKSAIIVVLKHKDGVWQRQSCCAKNLNALKAKYGEGMHVLEGIK